MLRIALLAFLTAASLSPAWAQSAPTGASPEDVRYLIDSAAADFRQSHPDTKLDIRDVRLGWVMTKHGQRQYQLCGAFHEGGADSAWTPFATLKTSAYEQWMGDTAKALCERDTLTWEASPGLTESLQDAMR